MSVKLVKYFKWVLEQNVVVPGFNGYDIDIIQPYEPNCLTGSKKPKCMVLNFKQSMRPKKL